MGSAVVHFQKYWLLMSSYSSANKYQLFLSAKADACRILPEFDNISSFRAWKDFQFCALPQTFFFRGENLHLDLDGILFLGGVRTTMFGNLPKQIVSKHGYKVNTLYIKLIQVVSTSKFYEYSIHGMKLFLFFVLSDFCRASEVRT